MVPVCWYCDNLAKYAVRLKAEREQPLYETCGMHLVRAVESATVAGGRVDVEILR